MQSVGRNFPSFKLFKNCSGDLIMKSTSPRRMKTGFTNATLSVIDRGDRVSNNREKDCSDHRYNDPLKIEYKSRAGLMQEENGSFRGKGREGFFSFLT